MSFMDLQAGIARRAGQFERVFTSIHRPLEAIRVSIAWHSVHHAVTRFLPALRRHSRASLRPADQREYRENADTCRRIPTSPGLKLAYATPRGCR